MGLRNCAVAWICQSLWFYALVMFLVSPSLWSPLCPCGLPSPHKYSEIPKPPGSDSQCSFIPPSTRKSGIPTSGMHASPVQFIVCGNLFLLTRLHTVETYPVPTVISLTLALYDYGEDFLGMSCRSQSLIIAVLTFNDEVWPFLLYVVRSAV